MSNNPDALLTPEEVIEARQLFLEGFPAVDIARAYGFKLAERKSFWSYTDENYVGESAPHNFYRMIHGETYAQLELGEV